MTTIGQPSGRTRAWAIVAVAVVHGAAALALLFGPTLRIPSRRDDPLTLFTVTPPVPPPIEPKPHSTTRTAAGAASAPNTKAIPTPIAAPRPIVPPPPPTIAAAPVPAEGVAASAGAAPLPGPGTGAGGNGSGLGSGSLGSGGGGGMQARLIRGAIVARDYPGEARRAKLAGSVTARFTVGTDGRVHDCSIARSSGVESLDETTCRLIEKRFRYVPARNSAGDPIAEQRGWRQDWWFDGAREASPG